MLVVQCANTWCDNLTQNMFEWDRLTVRFGDRTDDQSFRQRLKENVI